MTAIQAFAWISYLIICTASCLIIYEFLVKHLRRRKKP